MHFHLQSQPSSTMNNNNHIPKNESFSEFQFYTENTALEAALNRLISPSSQNKNANLTDETYTVPNEGVSIVSAPKNVKFLIPLVRSGITSNESTFGVIESTTRTITHVKDIFPYNNSAQSQIAASKTTDNVGESMSTCPISPTLITASLFANDEPRQNQNDTITSSGEQLPLLELHDSNQN